MLMIDKHKLTLAIIDDLESALKSALSAAEQAKETATNKENAAENKYDTLGLEAAYLAHGQSERVLQLGKTLEAFENLTPANHHSEASLGSLVSLTDDTGTTTTVFIGPEGGGLLVDFEGTRVTVVTDRSPLGYGLLGSAEGDEVTIEIAGKQVTYTITSLV